MEVIMYIREVKDNSFKLILGDNQLFVEFIRDFIPIDILKDVSPEDIEDVSARYIPLFNESRDSDTVKRINFKNQHPLFVIAIVEHESKVNFRFSFKMLEYITLVLDDYEKQVSEADSKAIHRKGFRYPPVLPIVFYDGPGPWTAETNFLNRTYLNEVFEKYIPKFEYEVVSLREYSPEELARFNDALSMVFIIDRIGTMGGKNILKELPPGYLEQMALKIPLSLTKLLSDVITSLLNRFGTEESEIVEITNYIEKKEMVTMFDALVEQHFKLREVGREEGREVGYNQAKAEDQERIRQDQEQLATKDKHIRQLEEEIRRLREGR
jgi:hypothetical protein